MENFAEVSVIVSGISCLLILIVLLKIRKISGSNDEVKIAEDLSHVRSSNNDISNKIDILKELISSNNESINSHLSKQREESGNSASSLRKEVVESINKLSDSNRDQFKLFGNTLNDQLDKSTKVQTQLAKTLSEQQDALKRKLDEKIKDLRTDLESQIQSLSKRNSERIGELTSVQKEQFELFTKTLSEGQKRHDLGQEKLTKSLNEQQEALRSKLDSKLKDLSDENAKKLDEMRKTVDEKLQSTLEKRLGESFKQVSERLEQVHKGLGEMQTLAGNVGDLKRTLTNVKTRGTWGEAQLASLLADMLTSDQYIENAEVKKNSLERVEFAIQLPGKDEDEASVLLPIDSKFPVEAYERLRDAAEIGDKGPEEKAAAELERSIIGFAKTISTKYINPPSTTDFAIMYLPTEGLFAEVLRRPGLADKLQRELRVIVTGPTTFAALLSSLQMGFRTLAVQKRSSEVWQVLAAVKTEFGKFGKTLASVRKKIDAAGKEFENVEVRTRALDRNLRTVEALPETNSEEVLGIQAAIKEGALDPV
ncbi:DNA recombination protein RmuC [Pseudovibrio sp. Ad26]|uniref:DNA recombination protein RmuC n=1 Tax=Pseudovibrio sp. Ad26 TaxID=989410 RepID=UPI0007AE87AC|nr:DNA recombination protein RmuC [Pseudovibrio sp. Ad26]KZL14838.1 RmuC family protein [Pseudovibrio sp. Ad26]